MFIKLICADGKAQYFNVALISTILPINEDASGVCVGAVWYDVEGSAEDIIKSIMEGQE
jgi:hypothetical protein